MGKGLNHAARSGAAFDQADGLALFKGFMCRAEAGDAAANNEVIPHKKRLTEMRVEK
jgi:hypothetical protein